jgi:hypothetical protein
MPNVDSTTEAGFWWLPDFPNDRLVGTVTYGPRRGFEVELVGALLGLEKGPAAWGLFDVWGQTVRGKPVTLLGAHQTSLQTHMPGYATSKIEASRGIVGGHYPNIDEVLVHTVDLQFDYLTAWAGQSGITERSAANNTWEVTIAPGNSVPLGQSEEITTELVPYVFHNRSRTELRLEERCELRLHADSPRSFPHFDALISAVRILLTFAAGQAAHPRQTKAQTPDKTAEINGKPLWREIEMIRAIHIPRDLREINAEDMLFTLRDLEPQPAKTFETFLTVRERLQPVFDLFFPTYFYPDMPPPQQFLNLVYATEALHRVTVGGQYQTDEDYESGLKKELHDAIPSSVSEDFRQSLTTKLGFLHEFSLRKRLRDLLQKYNELVSPYIPKHGQFVEAVSEARNCLVHATTGRIVPEYVELWKLAQQLGMLLEVTLLSEIGFQQERVRSIIARGRRAQLIRANVFREK